MKRIVNALLLLVLVSNLSGCASLFSFGKTDVKPVEVVTKPLEKQPLAIPQPDPLKNPPIKWVILTRDNAAAVFDQLEADGKDPVVFGLTDDGYKDLSIMFSEVRNFISTQRNIISKYKDYYEPPKASPEQK